MALAAAGQAVTGGIRYAGAPLHAAALFCLRAWIVAGPLLALVDPERAAFRTARRAAAAGAVEVAAVIGGVAFAVYYRVPLS